ncbi:hypothetical protein [Alienimonas sp. DA493]|uniref:hypothetical protein n=1 Tax=Alienimonas sp. DA493 TaxID=3373605 RepID=UPI0037548611
MPLAQDGVLPCNGCGRMVPPDEDGALRWGPDDHPLVTADELLCGRCIHAVCSQTPDPEFESHAAVPTPITPTEGE